MILSMIRSNSFTSSFAFSSRTSIAELFNFSRIEDTLRNRCADTDLGKSDLEPLPSETLGHHVMTNMDEQKKSPTMSL